MVSQSHNMISLKKEFIVGDFFNLVTENLKLKINTLYFSFNLFARVVSPSPPRDTFSRRVSNSHPQLHPPRVASHPSPAAIRGAVPFVATVSLPPSLSRPPLLLSL